jgi:hypothetical protein
VLEQNNCTHYNKKQAEFTPSFSGQLSLVGLNLLQKPFLHHFIWLKIQFLKLLPQ